MGTRGALWGPPSCSRAHHDQGPSVQEMLSVTLCCCGAPCLHPVLHPPKGREAAPWLLLLLSPQTSPPMTFP